jgi:hypothetical protein
MSLSLLGGFDRLQQLQPRLCSAAYVTESRVERGSI